MGRNNSRLRDELLNRELFLSWAEAQAALDLMRSEYNQQAATRQLGLATPGRIPGPFRSTPGRVVPGQPAS